MNWNINQFKILVSHFNGTLKNDLLPMGKNGDHLLVETSYFNPLMGLSNILLRIKAKAYHPILAHPEWYVYMEKKDYQQLKNMGGEVPAQPSVYSGYVWQPNQLWYISKAHL